MDNKKGVCLKNGAEYTDVGQDFIEAVKMKFIKKYPSFWKSIEPIIDNFVEPTNFYYIMYGLVQSGKSIALCFIMWWIIYKHGYIPIFLTKNLDSIRQDISIKMSQGCIPEIIDTLCKRDKRFREFNESNKNYFIPALNKSDDLTMYYKSKSENYSTRDGNVIVVFLMHKANYNNLVELTTRAGKKEQRLVFIIDEYHVWFPDQTKFIENGGSTYNKNENSISALDINYWLHTLRQEKQHFIIGISATLFRVLADPVLHPEKDQIINLHSNPPAPNLKYFSFVFNANDIEPNDFRWIRVRTYETKKDDYAYIMKIINNIRDNRDSYTEIPLVLITTEMQNTKQLELKKKIDWEFKDQFVRTEIFNQEHNNSLVNLFDKFALHFDDYEMDGIFVIIGDRRLDTGITVKPTKADQLEYIWGITDHILPAFSHLESNIQKLRLIGWYPEDHNATVWVPLGEADVYKKEMWDLEKDIMTRYDGTPKSISRLTTPSDIIQHMTGKGKNDTYKLTSKKTGYNIKLTDEEPEDAEILQTTYETIGERAREFSDIKLGDLRSHRDNQKKLRKYLHFGKLNFEQICYDDSRQRNLIESSFEPQYKDGKLVNGQQVNALVIPPPNSDIDCLIKDCLLVKFDETWENRVKISDDINAKLAFQVTDKDWYVYDGNLKSLEHKHIDQIEDFTLSVDHEESMQLVSHLPKKMKNLKKPRIKKSNGSNKLPHQCQGLTRKNLQCRRIVKNGIYCHSHSP